MLRTGVARNFDWGGGGGERKCENFVKLFRWRHFGDVVAMTSLKWRH